MGYIFDTNIFIRSKNEMPMEIWPTFWTTLADLINSGKVYSNVNVREEINKGRDELTTWMKANAPKYFYIQNDNDVMQKYAEVINWASSNPVFTQVARDDFAKIADAYLVAASAAKNMTLVTNEISNPQCKRRVKIPDACEALNVRYCNLNQVFRELGIKI
ncbi:MAG: DUF4411 family protein [Bacteroidota bacterium]|nr:DUF4411 family protein [Bacteroidota bacterium]